MNLLSTVKTVAPYHLLIYSFIFGATAYQSFYSGITAYRTLALVDFSKLQSRIFPRYFAFQVICSVALLATPPTRGASGPLFYGPLALSTIFSSLNLLLQRRTVQLTQARRRQEQLENKSYKDPEVSDVMKQLNKSFNRYHGASIAANMGTFCSLLVYGVALTAFLGVS